MHAEPRTSGSAGENNTGWYAGGDYEYVKEFPAPEEWRGQAAVLEFEGVYRNAEVWLGGEKIAFRPYGYTNFYVDLAPHLRYGEENELRVTARNADQPNSRWYSSTGIYRPVWLWTAGEDHIPVNGLRVRTLDYKTGEIEVSVRTSRPGPVSVEIFDADGTAPVCSASSQSGDEGAVFSLIIPGVKLWDCDTPNLYRCRARFGADTAEEHRVRILKAQGYNALACLMGDWFMKTGATLPPCDRKTRDAYANMDIVGYNYGIFRYKKDLRKYSRRLILGSETFCKDAYAFWEMAKQNPRIIGDFAWAGMDYIGETGEGCAEYSDYKFDGKPCRRMTGGNGRVDLLGKPRAEAAYTRVAFEREAEPYIAVPPVYQTEKLQLTGWQLTKALESWSWRGCAGMPAAVEVYARAHTVELLVNGRPAF